MSVSKYKYFCLLTYNPGKTQFPSIKFYQLDAVENFINCFYTLVGENNSFCSILKSKANNDDLST